MNKITTAEPCVHVLVASQAAAHPGRVAVVCGDQRLTYGELDARADLLADRLADHGGSLEVPVGVCLERSAEFVVAILAILKAGGYYVPLDPTYPPARLEVMLRATGAPAVVPTASLAERLPEDTAAVLPVLDETDDTGRGRVRA